MEKYASVGADTGGCWEVCVCGFFACTTNDDIKMMIQASLMAEVGKERRIKTSVGHSTSVTEMVFLFSLRAKTETKNLQGHLYPHCMWRETPKNSFMN